MEKITIKSVLDAELGCNYVSHVFDEDRYYYWIMVYYNTHPECVLKYHKEAKYFCDIISLNFAGVNPIFASRVTKASKVLENHE